jgi:rod shape-determining protein MreB
MAKLWSKWFGNGEIGIDLGTANTLVYVSGQGIVINEPTLVSINEKTGRVVAIGHDAKQMIGRTPGHLSVVKPLVDGVISNFEVAEEMLTYFMRKLGVEAGQRFFRPQVVIGVPSGITNVQIRAVRDAARNAGARAVAFYRRERDMADLPAKIELEREFVALPSAPMTARLPSLSLSTGRLL